MSARWAVFPNSYFTCTSCRRLRKGWCTARIEQGQATACICKWCAKFIAGRYEKYGKEE